MPNETEALINAARLAGLVAKQWRAARLGETGAVPTLTKLDGSIVTDADGIAQDEIQRLLLQVDENARFVGEEGDAGKKNLDSFCIGTRAFFVDPIDGTNSFVMGKPTWSVSIAYAEIAEGASGKILKTLAAVVFAPDKGELYYADSGGAMVEKEGVRGALLVLAEGAGMPMMTFYCKKISDSDSTEPMRKAMQEAAADTSVYRQDASKGSPALSLAAAARFVNNVVVTRGDDPFQPVTGGSVAPWDTLAGMFIYQKAGGEFSSLADRHGNVQVGTGNLSICVMGPSWELADRVAVALRNAAKS